MKKILLSVLVLLLSVSLFGCVNKKSDTQVKGETPQTSETSEKNDSTGYENTKYGFKFSLPDSWKGYTIVTDEWEGVTAGDSQSEKAAERGPVIYIRHPEWTEKTPRQDIPIMVFTITQWDALLRDEFHIGAAPIGPSELGRNSKYVFALPARYNYAFLAGYEEVENILKGKPLQPTEEFSQENK